MRGHARSMPEGGDLIAVSQMDRTVLRELACELAEIAALPQQQQTVSLWKALNGLEPVRATS